jgi:hypothetical protein
MIPRRNGALHQSGVSVGPTGKQFLALLKMASAISIDDGPSLTSWETSDLTGAPDNEILRISWNEGGTAFSTKLTEEGVSDGILFEDGKFVADDYEGESVLIRLFALHPLTAAHLPKDLTPNTPKPPTILFHASTARRIAGLIVEAGIPVLKVSEPNEESDGEIQITPSVHVQVGFAGCSVVTELPGSQFRFMDEVQTMENLLTDIHAGIEEVRTAPKGRSRPKH